MTNDVTIPDDIEGGPAAIFKEQNIPTERLGEGIDSGGFNMVGIYGKTFYVRYKGKKATLLDLTPRTDGSEPPASQYFDFVVLRQSAGVSHTWYEHGYQQGSDAPPDCVSTDGIAPDDSSRKKQSDLCQICPQHEWKDQPSGRRGRACTDSKRLAILPMPKLIENVIGEQVSEPILFRIPAASLKGFAEFGDQMLKRFGGNSPISSYVMRVSFKKEAQFPQFEYRLLRWLKPHEAPDILELREDPLAYRILGTTPDGMSLVRRNELRPMQNQTAAPTAAQAQQSQTAKQYAAERAERIAKVRQPETLELKAEKPPPSDADDIDALVASMRPRPPGG